MVSNRRAVLAAALLLPLPAAAHAILLDSVPAIRATAPAGRTAFMLRYNSRVDRARSRLTLMSPGKPPARLPIDADGPADQLGAAADLEPGAYVVRWQVLATDGHITRGDLPFTVQAP